MATQPNDAIGEIDFDAENTRMTVRVYSLWHPHVRLKVENAADPTITVETEATVTVADQWETLTFDFAQPAAGTAPFNRDL